LYYSGWLIAESKICKYLKIKSQKANQKEHRRYRSPPTILICLGNGSLLDWEAAPQKGNF
jgi:hypothetical protein